jgi:ABC-2 type transport system permease protein
MIRRKTWNEVAGMTLAYTLVLELMLVPAILLWPELRPGLAASVLQLVPMRMFQDMAKSIASPDADAAYASYMAIQLFFKGTNVVGISCAVLLGTGLIARERENQTLEFLLGRPVHRSRVLFDKFVVTALCVAVPIFLTSWSAVPLSWVIDEDLDFTGVTLGSMHAAAFAVMFLALTTFWSVLLRTQVHVAFVVGLIIVTQVAIFFVQNIRVASILMLSDFDTYAPLLTGNHGFDELFYGETIWLLAIITALYLAADRCFRTIEP